jgi:hypothetical protein
MSEWYRVEVSDHGGQIVAIEPEILSGRDIGEKERATILRAIDQLQGFLAFDEALEGVDLDSLPEPQPCKPQPAADTK